MPKKQSKNAFWFFMLDWKARQEAQGRTFPNGFRDVQADRECSDSWTSMSTQQRKPFVTRAKQNKEYVPKCKQTTTGEKIEELKLMEQRASDFKLNMEAHIRHTVFSAKKHNALPPLKFIFLHMNWYYMREPESGPEDFCPAEFAIAEFSVEEGVTDYYHEIINTEIYPGYRLEATETSQRTHQLMWNLKYAQGDWRIIYEKFFDFLSSRKTGGQFPPIYTSRKIVHVIPSLLRRMEDAVGEEINIFVYAVETLYKYMVQAVSDSPDSNMVRVITETRFDEEHFAYTDNIECFYHKELDGTGRFCSLSIVRQWGLTICDICCLPLKVAKVPGVHCPETSEMRAVRLEFNNKPASFIKSTVPSALSATGVSEAHRISRSERRRDNRRLQYNDSKPVIIDHSKLKDEEHEELKPKPEELYEAVALPTESPQKPPTASQALIGTARDAPVFDSKNFPSIGGRESPKKEDEPNQPQVSIWARRNRRNSDSD